MNSKRNILAIVLISFFPQLIGCAADHRISLQEFMSLSDCEEANTAKPTYELSDVDRYLSPYRVGGSDVIAFNLIRMDDFGVSAPIQVRVGRDGRVHLPMVGAVSVANLELEEVEEKVRSAYVPKIYRDLTVHAQIVQAQPTNVMVVGAVSAPGLVSLARNERNLLFAIISAGGASNMTSGVVRLRRLRRPGEEIVVNMFDPDGIRSAIAMAPLENGDVIKVESAAPNVVFVGGLVNAPQPEVYPPGVRINVLQAIAGAGGLRTDLTPKEATLIRRMKDGEDVHVKIEIDRMFKGQEPNIMLAAGDILWVPHTWQTRVEEWINRNVYLKFGAAANVTYDMYGVDYLNSAAEREANCYNY